MRDYFTTLEPRWDHALNGGQGLPCLGAYSLALSNAGLLYDVLLFLFVSLLLFSLLLLSLFSKNCSRGFSFTTTIFMPPEDLIPPELGNKHSLIATSRRNICRIFSSENWRFTSYLKVTTHSKLTVKPLSLERFGHD